MDGIDSMTLIFHAAWLTMTVLRFGGVAVVFAGVALFGTYFIVGNAKAARRGDRVPWSLLFEAGPKKAARILVVGAVMLAAAFVISLLMPNGT
jgi:hypothetical protein